MSAAGVTKPTVGNSDKRRASAEPQRMTILEAHGYRVGKSIGKGSYATVKEAYSVKHKSEVAIKIISKKKAPGDFLQKFLPREIDVVKILKHPNLIVFMQCIETTNRVYLVMEHASGGDLLDIVRERKQIPEKQSAMWFAQIVEGVAYCHSVGVVHRDLKCENVLLDAQENIKITDFGFARMNMFRGKDGRHQLSETYCGSYAYAAPEILSGTPYVCQMADIWSCGVILYVMLYGRLPFDDSKHKELLRQVRAGPVFPDRPVHPGDCKNMMQRILSKREERASISVIKKHPWFKRHIPLSQRMPIREIKEMKETSSLDPKKETSSLDSKKDNIDTEAGPSTKASQAACGDGTSSKTGKLTSAASRKVAGSSSINNNSSTQRTGKRPRSDATLPSSTSILKNHLAGKSASTGQTDSGSSFATAPSK